MRQKTVTDYITLPKMQALHVRKSLIADLSAGGVLALVELGFPHASELTRSTKIPAPAVG